ncbi:MAG: hypothetical protein WCD76_18005 [Pyrinomonadaceae bacterium]
MSDAEYATSGQGEGRCTRCGEERMRAWYELSAEEREVVKRLPASADFSIEERAARSRWCTRCWHEDASGAPRHA